MQSIPVESRRWGGGNALAEFLVSTEEARQRFLGMAAWTPESLQQAVAGPAPARSPAAEALARQNAGAEKSVQDALSRVEGGKTWFVTAGQQVGLLTGPLYTVYKAATVLRLTEALRTRGVDAVGLFWMATEDHDREEIVAARLLAPDGQVHQVRAELPEGPPFPAGRLSIGPSASVVREQFRATAGSRPFAAPVLHWLTEAVQPETTFGESFAALFRRLFAGTGLLLFDPLGPGTAELRRRFNQDMVERRPALLAAAQGDADQLRGLGFKPQAAFRRDRALWFYLHPELGRRRVVRKAGGRYGLDRGDDWEWSEEAWDSVVAAKGDRFSPDVLLRPVFQNWLFPPAACVGGPGEMAYHAQLGGLFQAAGVGRGVFWPRFSATILSGGCLRRLERQRLSLAEALESREKLFALALERRGGRNEAAEYRELQADLLRTLGAMDSLCKGFPDDMARSAAGTLNRIRDLERRLEERLGREMRNREVTLARRLDAIHGEVYPAGILQERALNVMTFIAAHGPDFVREIISAADPFDLRHRLLTG